MKLTKQNILDLNPCRDGLEFAKACNFDAVKIWNTCQRGDWLIWLLRSAGSLDKPTSVKIAVACARHVLEKFEEKHTSDKRPRAAIEATEKWISEPNEKNRKSAAAAADAAADAAAYADAAARKKERQMQIEDIISLLGQKS